MIPLRQTLIGIVRVALATLLVYVVVVVVATVTPFGGKPIVSRLVPVQNPGGPSHSLLRFREASAGGPVDFLFLGASHTYRGFDPRIFAASGYTSQNLGSTSQSPMNTITLLKRYLERLKPKVVIYEVYQTTLAGDGMESFYDLLSNTEVDFETVKMAWRTHQPQAWTALISTAVRNARTPLNSITQRAKEDRADIYVPTGYVERKSAFPTERLQRLLAGGEPTVCVLDDRQMQYLGECIDLVRQSGAVFTAVSYPIPAESRRMLKDFELNQQRIATYLKTRQVPYRDFNEEMTLNTATHYYDEVHLNQLGVEKFNQALLKWLGGQGLLAAPVSGKSAP